MARDSFRDTHLADPDSEYFSDYLEEIGEETSTELGLVMAALARNIMELMRNYPGAWQSWEDYLMHRFEEEHS